MRPQYETDVHLSAEEQIAAVLREHWNLTGQLKLSKAYGVDFALMVGRECVLFSEIKNRDLPFGFGDGYYVSLLKAMKAHLITATTGLWCVLVVRFRDGTIWWANFTDHLQGYVIRGGRTDRGDRFDIEPEVVFPWDRFNRVGPVPC